MASRSLDVTALSANRRIRVIIELELELPFERLVARF
jgi:hypothetical protein